MNASTKTSAPAVKFNKHHVTDGVRKARVHYSLDNRIDRRKCVTIYAKDYDNELCQIVGNDVFKDDSDCLTDYSEKGRAVLFEGHPLYAAARARAEALRDAAAKRSAT